MNKIINQKLSILLLSIFMRYGACYAHFYSGSLTIEQNETILSDAKKVFAETSSKALPLGDVVKWPTVLDRMRFAINKFNTVEEAIGWAQNHHNSGFDHRGIASLKNIEQDEEDLKTEFPHFADMIDKVGDSPYSLKDTVVDYKGHLVSNMFYYHYRYILQCLTYTTPKIVCEIGGGYGGPARLWMINPINVPDVYILIDFPECLFFAEIFLKSDFKDDPSMKILHLQDTVLADLDTSKLACKTVILCPIGKENALQSLPIDLVINTGSMQEMSDYWVDHWMTWLDESQANYFYSLNYAAVPIDCNSYEILGTNFCAPKLSTQWVCLLNSVKRYGRGAADIIAKRTSTNIDKESLRQTFLSALQQPFDAQNFINCLDIVRLCKEPEMIYTLIETTLQNMNPIPREVNYLINLLKTVSDKPFWDEKKSSLYLWSLKYPGLIL